MLMVRMKARNRQSDTNKTLKIFKKNELHKQTNILK